MNVKYFGVSNGVGNSVIIPLKNYLTSLNLGINVINKKFEVHNNKYKIESIEKLRSDFIITLIKEKSIDGSLVKLSEEGTEGMLGDGDIAGKVNFIILKPIDFELRNGDNLAFISSTVTSGVDKISSESSFLDIFNGLSESLLNITLNISDFPNITKIKRRDINDLMLKNGVIFKKIELKFDRDCNFRGLGQTLTAGGGNAGEYSLSGGKGELNASIIQEIRRYLSEGNEGFKNIKIFLVDGGRKDEVDLIDSELRDFIEIEIEDSGRINFEDGRLKSYRVLLERVDLIQNFFR